MHENYVVEVKADMAIFDPVRIAMSNCIPNISCCPN